MSLYCIRDELGISWVADPRTRLLVRHGGSAGCELAISLQVNWVRMLTTIGVGHSVQSSAIAIGISVPGAR